MDTIELVEISPVPGRKYIVPLFYELAYCGHVGGPLLGYTSPVSVGPQSGIIFRYRVDYEPRYLRMA